MCGRVCPMPTPLRCLSDRPQIPWGASPHSRRCYDMGISVEVGCRQQRHRFLCCADLRWRARSQAWSGAPGVGFCPRCPSASGPDPSQVSAAKVMYILSWRVAAQTINEELSPVLLEVDSAQEVLERTDEAAVYEEQHTWRRRQSERSAFREAYSARRRAVCPLSPAASSGQGKGRGRGRGGSRGRLTDAPQMPTSVDQATANMFLPGDSTIWRGLTRGEWCGQYANNVRIRPHWCERAVHSACGSSIPPSMAWTSRVVAHTSNCCGQPPPRPRVLRMRPTRHERSIMVRAHLFCCASVSPLPSCDQRLGRFRLEPSRSH